MKEKKTKAVYTIHEHNRNYYFFTPYAGGYSSPFATARILLSMHDALGNDPYIPAPMSAAALLPQLTGDLSYPPEADGKPLFRQLTESEAASYQDRNIHGDAIPFDVTINVNERTVAFAFNPLCKEIGLPDMELPLSPEIWASLYTSQATGKELTGWQAKEAGCREMMEQHALTLVQNNVPTWEMEQSV